MGDHTNPEPEDVESPDEDRPGGTPIRALDKAGRLPIRNIVGPEHDALVMTYGPGEYVRMMTLPAWRDFKRRVESLDPYDQRARRLNRYQIGPAETCAIDAAGRVRIPEALRKWAHLDRPGAEAQIINMGQRGYEIWAVDQFMADLGAASAALEDDETALAGV